MSALLDFMGALLGLLIILAAVGVGLVVVALAAGVAIERWWEWPSS